MTQSVFRLYLPTFVSQVGSFALLLCSFFFLLEGCGPTYPKEVQMYADALGSKNQATVDAAFRELESKKVGAIPALLVAIESESEKVRGRAALMLGQLLPKLKGVTDLNNEADKEVPKESYDLKLYKLVRDALYAVADKDTDWAVRAAAVLGLRRVPEHDNFSLYLKLIEDESGDVRGQAVLGLSSLAQKEPAKIHQALKVASGRSRKYLLAVSGKAKIIATLEEINKSLANSAWDIRAQAAMSLGEFGEDVEQFVPTLIKLLSDPDERVAFQAACALQKIGRVDGLEAAVKRFPDRQLIKNFEVIEWGEDMPGYESAEDGEKKPNPKSRATQTDIESELELEMLRQGATQPGSESLPGDLPKQAPLHHREAP